jgi:hypothetical protein
MAREERRHLREGQNLGDAQVQLSAQRLRELMLWHGTDEGNLPPAETLVNLSRDTVAALVELQHIRPLVAQLRAALAQLFWTCGSSAIRVAVLNALGAPPDTASQIEELSAVSWEDSPNGLPLPGDAAQRHRATG